MGGQRRGDDPNRSGPDTLGEPPPMRHSKLEPQRSKVRGALIKDSPTSPRLCGEILAENI